MSLKHRLWICIFLTILLATSAHAAGKGSYTFDAAVPEGWKTVDNEEPMMFMTKDGGYKQFVLIRERPLAEPFQFTKKTMRPDMMPEEAAEVIVNEILADNNIRNFSVTENIPAQIAGNRGFRMGFVYTDADGYVFKTIYYGFIKDGTFYNIRYAATQEDFFQNDLKTFENVFNSFRLVNVK